MVSRYLYEAHSPFTWGGAHPAPDGGDAWAPRPDETLIRALARAHRWKRLLEGGGIGRRQRSQKPKGATRSFVNRLLRLTLLWPDIVEAILDGRQAKGMALEELTRAMPSNVASNRRAVAAELDVTVPDRITAVIGMAETPVRPH